MGQSQSGDASSAFLEAIPAKHRIERVHKISAADFQQNYYLKV
jgi:hypothetical protein